MASNAYPHDWRDRRIQVLKRDDKTCTECEYRHTPDVGKPLHVHHVVPISDGGGHSLDNLVTLCEDCHSNAHTDGPPNPSRVPMRTCGRCEREYPDGYGFAGAFCSVECWSRFKANKALNGIHSNGRICSSCFSKVPQGAEMCPNCHNWDVSEVNREHLDVDDLDIEMLLAYVYRVWETGDGP